MIQSYTFYYTKFHPLWYKVPPSIKRKSVILLLSSCSLPHLRWRGLKLATLNPLDRDRTIGTTLRPPQKNPGSFMKICFPVPFPPRRIAIKSPAKSIMSTTNPKCAVLSMNFHKDNWIPQTLSCSLRLWALLFLFFCLNEMTDGFKRSVKKTELRVVVGFKIGSHLPQRWTLSVSGENKM